MNRVKSIMVIRALDGVLSMQPETITRDDETLGDALNELRLTMIGSLIEGLNAQEARTKPGVPVRTYSFLGADEVRLIAGALIMYASSHDPRVPLGVSARHVCREAALELDAAIIKVGGTSMFEPSWEAELERLDADNMRMHAGMMRAAEDLAAAERPHGNETP